MASRIEIYALTDDRNKEIIEQFLAAFSDRSAIEDRGDEELMVLRKDSTAEHYLWIKAETLTKSIEFGLAENDHCFTLYLKSNAAGIEQAMITFTMDGKLILGLSINEFSDQEDRMSNHTLAKELAIRLQQTYHCKMAYFETEADPVDTEAEFVSAVRECNACIPSSCSVAPGGQTMCNNN